MLTRRSFLTASTTLSLSNLLTGCSENEKLEVFLLQNSIPPQLIASFRKKNQESRSLLLKPQADLKELFTLLETWQGKHKKKDKEKKLSFPSFNSKPKKVKIGNLATIGNYWLPQAIKEDLITPISAEKITGLNQLPSLFKRLVQLNAQGNYQSDNSQYWAAPYRWGSTMIAYRTDKFEKLGWIPQDWDDLWKEELTNKFSLLDQPREVIGLTLKKLGHSYNHQNLGEINNLKSELIKLNKQVKFYDSVNYLQPLILGDTWLTVGWSSDILPITKSYSNISAIAPASGTSLWADLWVKPKNNKAIESDIINDWINFCWQTDSVNQISLFSNASSPLLLTLNKSEIAKDVIKNKLIYPDSNIINNSEFILPLSKSVTEEYNQLWKQIRTTNV